MFVFNDPTSSATPSLLKKRPVNAKDPVHHPQSPPPPGKCSLDSFSFIREDKGRPHSLLSVALGCIIMQM